MDYINNDRLLYVSNYKAPIDEKDLFIAFDNKIAFKNRAIENRKEECLKFFLLYVNYWFILLLSIF